jgi:hypothetical protein
LPQAALRRSVVSDKIEKCKEKKMNKQQSELLVIIKAKDLCGYVMQVTQKSPKQSLAGFKGHLKHGHTYYLRKTVFRKFVLKRDSL